MPVSLDMLLWISSVFTVTRSTFADAVVRQFDAVHAGGLAGARHILQLLLRLRAHRVQLGHVVLHVRDVRLDRRAHPRRRHLQIRVQ